MTTFVILIALALLWGIVLVPPWIKKRSHRSTSADAIAVFSQQLSRLERGSVDPSRAPVLPLRPAATGSLANGPTQAERQAALHGRPGGMPVPKSADDARRRRRSVLLGLAAAAFVTLLGAIGIGGAFIALHLLVDIALLGYVMLLVQYQRRLEEVHYKVRPIRPVRTAPRPETSHADLLQRSGS